MAVVIGTGVFSCTPILIVESNKTIIKTRARNFKKMN
jgi:hypothetical protein